MNDFKNYNPLFFLSSLGAGGLSVSFFVYLMFLTEHKETPVPTFESIIEVFFNSGNLFFQALIIFAILGIVIFGFMHFYLLIKNLRIYSKFKKEENFQKLKKSPAEVSLMAIPLTLAMTMNTGFAMCLIFVPGLWSILEYVFPFAIIGFLAIGAYAIRIFGDYFTRIILNGDDEIESKHNNLSQMISIFAFSMIGVGLAGPAAMSHTESTSAIAFFASIFFITISVFLAIIKITLGFKSMLKKGISVETSPSMWIIIPIITLVGIALIRMTMGLDHNFGIEHNPMGLFVLTSVLVSLQILFGFIGYKIMKANHYFKNYLNGEQKSAGSYALVCPGVASFVFGMFFIHYGLIQTNLIAKFGCMHFALIFILFVIQIITIRTLFKLNRKFL